MRHGEIINPLTSIDVRTLNPDGTKTAWNKVEAPPDNTQPDSRTKQLYLVRHSQAEGEPFHWSLETADVEGGDLEGNVYQVSGDAEFMDYRPNQVRARVSSRETLSSFWDE